MCHTSTILHDVFPYSYYNHYANNYVLIYAYSKRMGYITIKLPKTNNWYDIYDNIVNINSSTIKLPMNDYDKQKKYYFKIRHSFPLFISICMDKKIYDVIEIKMNDITWKK